MKQGSLLFLSLCLDAKESRIESRGKIDEIFRFSRSKG